MGKADSDSNSGEGEGGKEVERGQWGNQIEFILTCVGYAVGLGNVWRFPYLTYESGGGAFLIPYFLMLVLVGWPMFYCELVLGQFTSRGSTQIWSISPFFRGVGFTMLANSFLIGLFYTIIIAWAFYYLFASFASELPWTNCGAWSDIRCIRMSDLKILNQNSTALNITLTERNLTSVEEFQSPSEQFFYNQVIKMSSGIDEPGNVVWQLALCLLLAWTLVFLILIKGIASLGKVVYFISLFPYVMMTVLLVRSCLLEGASVGILDFYLKADTSRLSDAKVWSDAAAQIFFSLSCCSGGLHAMSSFNRFHNNVQRDALIIPVINCLTSFYGAFVTFAILGFMADQKGVTVDQVADQGPGLVFVVYPEALTQMPIAPLWSVLFFIMLLTLGFSSILSSVEAVFTILQDEIPYLRSSTKVSITFRAISCFILYLISLPMVTEGGYYVFNMVEGAVGTYPLLITGLLQLVAVSYVYGVRNFAKDIEIMIGRKPFIIFQIEWALIAPILLFIIVITSAISQSPLQAFGVDYPSWGQSLYWVIVAFALMWPVVFAIIALIRDGTIITAFKRVLRPAPNWGPANPEDRVGKYYDGPIMRKSSLQSSTIGSTMGSNGGMYPSVYSVDQAYENKAYDDYPRKTY